MYDKHPYAVVASNGGVSLARSEGEALVDLDAWGQVLEEGMWAEIRYREEGWAVSDFPLPDQEVRDG